VIHLIHPDSLSETLDLALFQGGSPHYSMSHLSLIHPDPDFLHQKGRMWVFAVQTCTVDQQIDIFTRWRYNEHKVW